MSRQYASQLVAAEIAAHVMRSEADALRTVVDGLPRKARAHGREIGLIADRLSAAAALLLAEANANDLDNVGLVSRVGLKVSKVGAALVLAATSGTAAAATTAALDGSAATQAALIRCLELVEGDRSASTVSASLPQTEEPPNVLGSKLEMARKFEGLTRNAMAAEIGVDAGTFARWERGRSTPSRASQIRIEEYLDLAPGTIATWASGVDD